MKKSSKKSSKDKARETVKKEDLKNISGGHDSSGISRDWLRQKYKDEARRW
ncbi:hypothetical protein [Legionella clemsonensis]|uniref:Uncharacterized protein n=1 Tax=Legionella clemsonensis TaxID=1867846 RepID=A0A222NZR5_9GAMM|nr:hypothetical protein [Legionella clemsonensis]ASQ45087.1 hypothetical protein clem_02630 [Legionella clemsonensis]